MAGPFKLRSQISCRHLCADGRELALDRGSERGDGGQTGERDQVREQCVLDQVLALLFRTKRLNRLFMRLSPQMPLGAASLAAQAHGLEVVAQQACDERGIEGDVPLQASIFKDG
jgi:hypothetical protein